MTSRASRKPHGYRFLLPGASRETCVIHAWSATEARAILRRGMPVLGNVPKGVKMREVKL